MLKQRLFGIFVCLFVFVLQGYSGDAVEYFYDSDISCVYYPDSLHPENSYLELKLLFAHIQDGKDFKSSGFNYEIGDSEYTGVYLYLNDTKFMLLGCQDGDAKALVIDTITKAKISDILDKGWKIRQFTPQYAQAPLKPSDHTCTNSHYCYFVIDLYPPTSMSGKDVKFRIDGGPDKNYKGNNKWCWWREGSSRNQYGKSEASCKIAYPYQVGTLEVLNGKVDKDGHLLIDYHFMGGNSYDLAEGTYKFGSYKVTKNAGFLSGQKNAFLQNTDLSGSSVVKKYDGTSTTAEAKFTLPSTYQSDASAQATYVYYGFPYAKLNSVEFDMESKSAALTWDITGKETFDKDYVKEGRWYVQRTDDSTHLSMIVSEPLPLATTTWTDNSIEYNKEKGYTYTVIYRQNTWGGNFDSILSSNGKASGSTNPNTGLVVTATGQNDRVKINAQWNASKVDNFYNLKLWRGSVMLAQKKNIKAGECSFDYEDVNAAGNKLYARVSNAYKVELLNSKNVKFDEQSVLGNITGGTLINRFTASRGNYKDRTQLIWTAERAADDNTSDTYIIERRTIGEGKGGNQYEEIGRLSSVTSYMTYEDTGAAPGEYYEYRVGVLGDQNTIINTRTAIGFANASGSISGNVTLADGSAQSGVKVSLEPVNQNNTGAQSILLHCLDFNNQQEGQIATMQIQQDAADYRKWMNDDWTLQFWCRPSMDNACLDQQLLTLPGTTMSLRVLTESPNETFMLCKSSKVAGVGDVLKSVKIGSAVSGSLPWAHITLRKQNMTSASSANGSRNVRLTMDVAYLDSSQQQCDTTVTYDYTESYPEENFQTGLEEGNLSVVLGRVPMTGGKGDALITNASQFSSNASDSVEGTDFGALIDGNPSTFWHSDWHNTSWNNRSDTYHHLQVALGSEYTGNIILNITRRKSNYDHSTKMLVWGSKDGAEFTEIATLNLSYDGPSSQVSAVFYAHGVKYLRFASIDGSPEFRTFWHAAEFQLYKCNVSNYNGLIDEVRMFSRAIDNEQLADTRYCRLSGSEKGLICYLPMDEGINGYTFDHAKASNGNHYAILSPAIVSQNISPTGFNAYSATTDAQGFYSIDGIEVPDKTTFVVKASKDMLREAFSPSERYCTISAAMPTFNNQNFVDNSSVTVNGRVRYRYGTFPVEGCTVYVDGKAVQRDGNDVLTDANGEFAVDVPVGKHYLQVGLSDHGFLEEGRFPAVGEYDFQRDTAYIAFTDSTLVLLRGRVSGGGHQANLPLGVGYSGGSQALIGQATLYLSPVSNLNYRINESETETRDIPVAENDLVAADTAACTSTEQWLPYEANPTIPGQILIKTDPLTGEFRALLPPMSYYVTYAMTKSVSNDELRTNTLSEFTLTPGNESSLIVRYDTTPIVKITDQAHTRDGVNDGMLGEDTLVIDSVNYPVIHYDGKGNNHYVTGYPIFRAGKSYTLLFDAYQQYVNNDHEQSAVTRVPMSNELVTLRHNQWADGRTDTLRMSDNGIGNYQFTASSPSSNEIPLYGMEVTFNLGGRTYMVTDEPIMALFTGFSLTEGMETLVEGPTSVDYILRDPPGSRSYAVLQEGSTISSSMSIEGSHSDGTQSEFHWNIGADIDYSTFSLKAISTNSTYSADSETTSTGSSMSSTTTTTETYSTGTDAFHVGSAGDVYIGHCTYIGYGKGYCYEASPNNAPNSEFSLLSEDGKKTAYFGGKETMGYQIGNVPTRFALAQRYIEETLIPEWENIAKTATSADSIVMAENNVNQWKYILAQNEMEKLTYTQADTTVSYSAGVESTYTKYSSSKINTSSTISGKTSLEWKVGGDATISVFLYVNVGGGKGDTSSTTSETETEMEQEQHTTVSYTIRDDDFMDYQQFDVTYAQSGLIYHLKAGATSNPYEGEEVTKYFSPGSFIVQPATLMVDKCDLMVVNPNITDIPNGREATLLLDITNASEVGKSDYFYLFSDDESSASGLTMTIDGAPITANGIPLFIEGNTTIRKTVKVKQSRTDILDFENAKLFLRNADVKRFEFHNPNLSPESTFSIHFTPSSSPVTFSVRNIKEKPVTTVNLSSGSQVLLRATDYQTDYTGFYKMRLQYKAASETQWHTLAHEYTVNELQGTSQKDTLWNMSDLADGTYQLRAVTMSHYGTGDVTFESDTVTIVKDMVAPCLLGEPSPINGILDCENQIRYNFNEPIYSGAVTKSNVKVLMRQGSTNPDADTKYSEIPFDLIVSDEVIQIEPTLEDRLMEGNTLLIQITDIEDLNGNKMTETLQREIFVHMCPFVWGAEGNDKAVTLSNISSGIQSWTLQEIPSWLTIVGGVTNGTLSPYESITLIYKAKDDIPVGEYSGTLRVSDNKGLTVDHAVYANVTSDLKPNWAVETPGAFFNSTLTAHVEKTTNLNAYDLVGAFIDGKCVGTSSPIYMGDETGYLVMMNLYTDSLQIDKDITLKVYDALHDVVYPHLLVYDSDDALVTLKSPANHTTIWGTPDAPWKLSVNGTIEKTYSMRSGWNWISLFAELDSSSCSPSIFVPASQSDALTRLKTQTEVFSNEDGAFHGDIEPGEFIPGILMMAHCKADYEVDVQGSIFDPAKYPVTLKAKSSSTGKPSYNWMGYTAIDAMPLEMALAQLSPVEGDIIKGQTDFAYYTYGMWVGTLTYLRPLKGYIYTSCADVDRTFCFADASASEVKTERWASDNSANPKAGLRRIGEMEGEENAPWEWNPTQWSMNMTVLAKATLDGEPLTEGYVGIFDNDSLCRSVKPINADGRIYLTVSGDDKCKLTMRLRTVDGNVYEMPCPFDFLSNDSRGTYTAPIELKFYTDPNAVKDLRQEDCDDALYDLSGRRLSKPNTKGVYIRNGEKVIY